MAGDGGSAVTAQVAESSSLASAAMASALHAGSQEGESRVDTAAGKLIFIDSAVENIEVLCQGLAASDELILIQPDKPGLDQMHAILSTRSGVSSVHIISHGQAGRLQLGNQLVDLMTLDEHQVMIQSWANSLAPGADILVYGCETGANAIGKRFVQRLADITGADVAASIDRTGASTGKGDWELERKVGVIETELAIKKSVRDNYQAVLPITIRAAGTTGEEQMLLQIDGETVATFNNVSTTLQDYTVAIDNVEADRIRVAFTNDLYDPANGIDRNLRVDRITIDGTVFETESPDVFSTGTYLPADGITPGFRLSETLHSNGYFQYANKPTAPGDPLGLVINEIHYNPGPDGVVDGDAEFLELYNSSDQAVDLSGMSFRGFNLTFAAGTTLGAGQYAIVSPSIALAQSTWGVTPIAQFASGGLAGSGELIQLIAADGVTVIDEVNYLDQAPWPSSPDGNGPSLELRDWTFNNAAAENWGASLGSPTPAAQNSIYGQAAPDPITDIVITPSEVLPNQAFTINANIAGATTANLIYKVMFGEEQTVAMTNIGGDTWQALLPGADAGTLIRYRISSDVAIAPFNDSINYFGLVVSPTDITGNELPLFQFFVDEAKFTELTTTSLALTNTKIEAVVYYNGSVIDNATVRVRGGDFARTNYPKKSLKFELPSGYAIDIGSEGSYPIDEFGINADFGDWSVASPDITWDLFNAETESFTSSFFVRAERNGEFHGIFRFQELYDGAWREANGISGDDEFYQAENGAFGDSPRFDKQTPDDGDFTTINTLNAVLASPPSGAKTAFLYDKVNIANVINHMALSALTRHDDQEVQNFYMARDAQTGVWSIVEWDLDRLWVVSDAVNEGGFTTPEPIDQELLNSVWEVPEFREMYWRRMQTLVDTYLSEESRARFVARFDEIVNQIGQTNSSLEFAKWNRNDIFANPFWRDEFAAALDARAAAFAIEGRLPGTATGNASIVINEIHYNPLDGDAEFLELYNASATESVDLSGWRIEGVNHTIGFGTVLLPGQHIVFTDNFARLRTQAPGNVLIGGQYSGGLSGSGELITLLDRSGNVVDQVSYLDRAPWTSAPDGTGFTLALVDPSLDNSLASSWIASQQLNGTPGTSNDSQSNLNSLSIFAAGTTGTEVLALEIAGELVEIFDLSIYGSKAGDLDARNFVELIHRSTSTIDINDVRIYFTNDVYDLANGIDANLGIDRIVIDGVTYETESPEVFSSGTWLPSDGIIPGFRQSEILHINGFFQYASVPVNQVPVAANDSFVTLEGNPVSGNLLGNDSDPDQDILTIISNSTPANGSVTIQSNGDFTYSPAAGFRGPDSFTYTISDGKGGTSSATVTITVQPRPIFVNGNVIQMINFEYDAFLAASRSDAVTSTTNNTATRWRLISAGNGDFRLQNVANGRYLDGDSSDVDTSSSSTSFGTVWRFIEFGSGYYYLFNVAYREYLDANGRNQGVDWDPGTLEADDRWLVRLV